MRPSRFTSPREISPSFGMAIEGSRLYNPTSSASKMSTWPLASTSFQMLSLVVTFICGRAGDAVSCFDYYLHRPDAELEIWVHMGDHIAARDGQPVGRFGCRQARRRIGGNRRSRSTDCPIDEQHPPGLTWSGPTNALEIQSRCHSATGCICSVPSHRVPAGWLFPIYQGSDVLPKHIEDLQPHVSQCR